MRYTKKLTLENVTLTDIIITPIINDFSKLPLIEIIEREYKGRDDKGKNKTFYLNSGTIPEGSTVKLYYEEGAPISLTGILDLDGDFAPITKYAVKNPQETEYENPENGKNIR